MLKNIIIRLIKVVLRIFYIFPIHKNKVFFLNAKENGYGYDGKAITEAMLNDYNGMFQIIWGYYDIEKFNDDDCKKLRLVNVKSVKGLYHILTSEAIIYNVNAPMYIPYRKDQLLFNTWHGYPFKKVGKDAKDFFNKEQVNYTTYYLSHSAQFDRTILRNAFDYEGVILQCGIPRNDILVKNNSELREKMKRRILGSDHRKIVMYAPTYRSDLSVNKSIDSEKITKCLSEKFGGDWLVFVRMHSKVKDTTSNSDLQLNVTSYPDTQDLLLIVDVLITDYSGTLWDFALTKRPIFIYAPDIEDYSNSRGLYDHYYELPYSTAYTEEELMDNIKSFQENSYNKKLSNYLLNQGSYEKGIACKTVIETILNHNND